MDRSLAAGLTVIVNRRRLPMTRLPRCVRLRPRSPVDRSTAGSTRPTAAGRQRGSGYRMIPSRAEPSPDRPTWERRPMWRSCQLQPVAYQPEPRSLLAVERRVESRGSPPRTFPRHVPHEIAPAGGRPAARAPATEPKVSRFRDRGCRAAVARETTTDGQARSRQQPQRSRRRRRVRSTIAVRRTRPSNRSRRSVAHFSESRGLRRVPNMERVLRAGAFGAAGRLQRTTTAQGGRVDQWIAPLIQIDVRG